MDILQFIRSGQNYVARHSEMGGGGEREDKADRGIGGRQHQGMGRPGVRQVPEGSEEQRKMEETGCKIICDAPTTLAVKRQMMMMMRSVIFFVFSFFSVYSSTICS